MNKLNQSILKEARNFLSGLIVGLLFFASLGGIVLATGLFPGALNNFSDGDVYYATDPISVSGQMTVRESDLPVTIQVFNMQQELVQIEQFVPNPDNTFNFTIPTTGKQFQKEGVYHIKAQYGVQEHTAGWAFSMLISSPFPVPNDVLLQIWNTREDLQITLPEVSDGNFEKLKEWAQKTGWNQDERLSILIPEGKTPDYMKPTSLPFPVSDDVLLEIWNSREDLQITLPEV